MAPVLLMVRQLGLGGSERQLTEIARALDRSQFEPHVACFHPSGLRAAELEAAGVPVLCLELRSFLSFSALAAFGHLSEYIHRHGIRLVHTFDSPTNIYVPPAVRFCSSAVILTSQRAHRQLTPPGGRQLLRLNDRIVDGIVVNCEFLRRHLIEDEKVPRSLVHLCYNGLDTRVFYPAQPESRPAALQDASIVVGVVCALRPEKGLDTLISAFARIHSQRSGLKLAIIGSGPCREALEAQARSLGIDRDCLFQPGTADVAYWLRLIDIFVLPSRSEALSNSIMEAMACGCSVIASGVGGNPELVAHRERGLLFRAGDADELAAALRLLLENEPLRRRLAAAGRDFIRENFSLEASARRMEAIYSSMLADAA